MLELHLIASTASAATASVASVASTLTSGMAETSTTLAATGTVESLIETVLPSIVASALPDVVTTTTPVTASALSLPVSFEVAAIFAGALAGGLTAVGRKFDITGLLTLAIVAGLGGGIVRDLLLQDQGVFALETPRALIGALMGAVVAMFFFSAAEKLRPALNIMDALSLSLFCLVGADKALVAGLLPIAAIMLGTITSVGGGIMRDILCDKEPEVLRRGSFYSLAAIVGSTLYVTMVVWLNFAKYPAMLIAGTLTVLLRFGSMWLGWETPEPMDISGAVVSVPRTMWSGGRRLLRRKPPEER